MKKKIALALVSLLMVLLGFFALFPPASSSPGIIEKDFYVPVEGTQTSYSELMGTKTGPRESKSTPFKGGMNISFSEAWEYPGYGWIVNITVPKETFVPSVTWEYQAPPSPIGWVKAITTYSLDGHGWIFLNASCGDVDCYTKNDGTNVYWTGPSPKTGEIAAAGQGKFPNVGADGVPGTADDGFGNGTKDPAGSSILLLQSFVNTTYWDGSNWQPMFKYNWTSPWTTQVAYHIINKPGSLLDRDNSTEVGHPWEMLAGLDTYHPTYKVAYGHPKWNAWVKYASAYSTFGISTFFGTLNTMVEETSKYVRSDCVVMDISGDNEVKIRDIVLCALKFGKRDLLYPTRTEPDPGWDPSVDVDGSGEIRIRDIVLIALGFGTKLTPDCIYHP